MSLLSDKYRMVRAVCITVVFVTGIVADAVVSKRRLELNNQVTNAMLAEPTASGVDRKVTLTFAPTGGRPAQSEQRE